MQDQDGGRSPETEKYISTPTGTQPTPLSNEQRRRTDTDDEGKLSDEEVERAKRRQTKLRHRVELGTNTERRGERQTGRSRRANKADTGDNKIRFVTIKESAQARKLETTGRRSAHII